MYRSRLAPPLALIAVLVSACGFESARDGDHGVALEDTTLVPVDSAATAQRPAIVEAVTSQ